MAELSPKGRLLGAIQHRQTDGLCCDLSAVVPYAAPKISSLQYASPDPNPNSLARALASGPSSRLASDQPLFLSTEAPLPCYSVGSRPGRVCKVLLHPLCLPANPCKVLLSV